MVTDKDDSPSRTPTQEVVVADVDATAAAQPTTEGHVVMINGEPFPWITGPPPRPHVTMASMHSWRYGEGYWVEFIFEGENVAILNQAYGGANRYSSLLRAAVDLGAHLTAWGIGTSDLRISFVEHEEPKREPRTGSFADTAGSIADDGLTFGFGGACPVQGDGEVDGRVCYYRARARGWQFAVWAEGVTFEQADCGPVFEYAEDPYAFPDGSWLHRDESIANIRRAVAKFRLRDRTPEGEP